MTEPNGHVIHHDGYGKGLELTLSICLCYTLCVLGLRMYIRWRAFGTDDLVVSLSTVLAFIFFGCNYASSSAGLGRPTRQHNFDRTTAQRLTSLYLASNISWITALCLSKLAIVSLLLRTTVTASHQRLQYFVGALISAQWITTVILMTAGCTSFEGLPWDFTSNTKTCSRQTLRWHAITGLDVATELAILSLPLQLVWKLQMPSKSKLIVIVAFWLRIPTLVFTILRNERINDLNADFDVSLTAAMVVVWQSVEMSYSIAAATIAALKRFTESLNTGFGHGELIRVHGQSQIYKLSDRSASLKDSGSKPTNSAEPLPELAKQRDPKDTLDLLTESSALKLRPEIFVNEVTVSSLSQSKSSNQSVTHARRPKDNDVRQDVRYSVHYDEQPLISSHKQRR